MTPAASKQPKARKLKGSQTTFSVVGLFAGIGGIELGLARSGHESVLMCEIDDGAHAVLTDHFPQTEVARDVRNLPERLPEAEVIAAGFPCQDLSQAGRTAGIGGKNSGLVGQIFRRLTGDEGHPRWLVLENVSFMLQLDRGKAMQYLVDNLEERGFAWAYRVVDTRAFGLPQRRKRVILVASRTDDPRAVLFADEAGEPPVQRHEGKACGFYWTEGSRGLGWAVDAVPTLKGGSTIGIASPPAIWMPDGRIVTPDIRDAERLQGFEADWTLPAVAAANVRKNARWKLVGNAVSVPVFSWVGDRLSAPGAMNATASPLTGGEAWPMAAWGSNGEKYRVEASQFPLREPLPSLASFLKFPVTPLSERATAGFLKRAEASSLRFADGFLDAVRSHLRMLRHGDAA